MSLKRNRNTLDADGFVFYGTALPSQGSGTRDDGSYVPLWKQEVTDERGRKRLHGAFTGGFSAGYFNTVGSKEGWTPATFKSSRAARIQATPARPEDFMDAEDLAEAAEAQRIEMNQNFSGLGPTEDELVRQGKQITLMDLLTPATEDTMGVKLLKKMGWKEGQGVGSKVRRKALVLDEGEEDDAMDEKTYLLAPANPALVTFSKKFDTKGMGYVGEGSLEEREYSHQGEPKLENIKIKKQTARGGFGVGVLNDDDENDDDPYEIRPKTAYNRVIGGDKPKKIAKPHTKNPAKHVFVSKKTIKAKSSVKLRKCHDGRFPLDGFILSLEPIQSQDGWYLPPEVPADWVPAGPKGSQTNKDQVKSPNWQNIAVRTELVATLKLDPQARGSLLGEVPLPGKSVFDFMTPAARERIAAVTGNKNLPQALGEAPPSTFSSSNPASLADFVPKLNKDVAFNALRGGFMPYSDDPDKKARYRTFLEVQAGLKDGLPDRKYGMNTQDWIKELNEFMGAARIFKPLTGMIATRFTSSTASASNAQDITTPINTDPSVFLHHPQPKPEDPAETAAKMSMYGSITRSIAEFFPTRLLCKRFNVKPPAHVDPTGGTGENGGEGWGSTAGSSRELVSKTQMTEMMREVKGDQSYTLLEEVKTALPIVDTETNEALEAERAGEDVFKAIFGDDEDDGGDE